MRTIFTIAALVFIALTLPGCRPTQQSNSKQLTLAINSGVEGDALKQAALDYEKQTGVHINIAEFPYANLFEKELIDLNAHTGAYDLIMLDDPWFPRFASQQFLTDLTPLLQKRGQNGPEADFIATLNRALPQSISNRLNTCTTVRRQLTAFLLSQRPF